MKLTCTAHCTTTRTTSSSPTQILQFLSGLLHISKYIPACCCFYTAQHGHITEEPRHHVSLMNVGQGWWEREKNEESELLMTLPNMFSCDDSGSSIPPVSSLLYVHTRLWLKVLEKTQIWQPLSSLCSYMEARHLITMSENVWSWLCHVLPYPPSSPQPRILFWFPFCFTNSHWCLVRWPVFFAPPCPTCNSPAHIFHRLNYKGQEMCFIYHPTVTVLHAFNLWLDQLDCSLSRNMTGMAEFQSLNISVKTEIIKSFGYINMKKLSHCSCKCTKRQACRQRQAKTWLSWLLPSPRSDSSLWNTILKTWRIPALVLTQMLDCFWWCENQGSITNCLSWVS